MTRGHIYILTSTKSELIKIGGTDHAPMKRIREINAWPLSLGPDGKVVIAAGYPCPPGNSHGPFALSDRLLVSANFIDPTTGKVLPAFQGKGKGPNPRLGISSLAGRYLLSSSPTDPQQTKNRWPKAGSPAVAQLTTVVWDLADATAPKKVGENVLTVAGFTPDISAKHFPKAAELYPTAEMSVGHCNYQGIGFSFAVDTSGLTAIGKRIYLHSPAHLICLGER
jgi:hypothetical protein